MATSAAWPRAITIEAAGREVRLSSPSKVNFPEPGFTKLDLAEYYLAVADAACLHVRERPTTMKRFVDGIIGELDLPEAGAEEHAGVAADGDGRSSPAGAAPRSCGQRRRAPGVGRQPGRDRLQPVARAPGRPRPSGRAARRPGPDPGVGLRRGPPGGDVRARGPRRPRAARLPQDLRLARDPHQRADRARGGRSRRCAARRSPWRARSSAGRPTWRHRSGGRRSATACSSTTTRTPATARWRRPGRCARRPTPASRAAGVGRGARRRPGGAAPGDGAGAPRRAGRPVGGDRRRPPAPSTPCTSWPTATRPGGLGDAPWPPHFRKQAGEGKRVQPSRAKKD